VSIHTCQGHLEAATAANPGGCSSWSWWWLPGWGGCGAMVLTYMECLKAMRLS